MENKNYTTWVCIDGPKNILGLESRIKRRSAEVGDDLGLCEVIEARANGYDPSELKIFYIFPEGETWCRISSPRVVKRVSEDVRILESPFGGEDYVFKRKR